LKGLRVREVAVPSGEKFTLGDSEIRVECEEVVHRLPVRTQNTFHGLVARSAAMRALVTQIERAAPSEATVLIQGETGAGKERVAEVIHLTSQRANGPLVIVDCGSLPANLVESELFGHEKGAFTGAHARSAGAFERAARGTIFLDEIAELPLDVQPKLLRAIETREVTPLGGGQPVRLDIRVLAATHRDLGIEVSKGRFREDLFYRLAVLQLRVPSLRERGEDLPLLAIELLTQMGHDPNTCLSEDSLQALAQHDWPGNVRELRNTLESAAAMSEPLRLPMPGAVPMLPASCIDIHVPMRLAKARLIEQFERQYLTSLMEACDSNVSLAARQAGVDRMSIYRLMQRLKVRPAIDREDP
jgi:DNA-binding NtrC family response regulator